jgi:hypothetical protein
MRASDSISDIFGRVCASVPANDLGRRLLATTIPILHVAFTQIQNVEPFLIALASLVFE